jgi:hypothetical protein
LKSLPQSGPLFPNLMKMASKDRANEFRQRCHGLGITGATLHCYRYAWAERARKCGFPQRFAQQALGHNSKAVHAAYAKKAEVHLPSLEDWGKRMKEKVLQHQIEDFDTDLSLFNHLVETFPDGPYWHRRIKGVLAAAGFATRRIEREEAHPIWLAWLTRTTFDLAIDNRTAIKQIRKVLNDGGIKIARDEFNIIDRRGDKLKCVFLLDLGVPGVT